MKQVASKCWLAFNRVHSIISQETELFSNKIDVLGSDDVNRVELILVFIDGLSY
jgi:hypothetical protein